MKKSILLIALGLLALLGLTGCDDRRTPESTLAAAYDAVMKGKLDVFQRTLADAALDRYGNVEGLAALKQDLTGVQVSFSAKTYRGGRAVSFSHKIYAYTIDIIVKSPTSRVASRYKTAIVVCDSVHKHRGLPRDPSLPADASDSTECRITELK